MLRPYTTLRQIRKIHQQFTLMGRLVVSQILKRQFRTCLDTMAIQEMLNSSSANLRDQENKAGFRPEPSCLQAAHHLPRRLQSAIDILIRMGQ